MVEIKLPHTNRGYRLILVGFVVIYPLFCIYAACVKGEMRLSAWQKHTTLWNVHTAHNVKKLRNTL